MEPHNKELKDSLKAILSMPVGSKVGSQLFGLPVAKLLDQPVSEETMSHIRSEIHRLRYLTQSGKFIHKCSTRVGLLLLKTGRKLICFGGGRCTWCGLDCGFDSMFIQKGMRCYSGRRDCTKF